MCTEQLPPGGYPIAVKYIILYHTAKRFEEGTGSREGEQNGFDCSACHYTDRKLIVSLKNYKYGLNEYYKQQFCNRIYVSFVVLCCIIFYTPFGVPPVYFNLEIFHAQISWRKAAQN
jgi:hypothetical protein